MYPGKNTDRVVAGSKNTGFSNMIAFLVNAFG